LDKIKTIEKLNKFQTLNNNIRKKILKFQYLSTYNDETYNFIRYYRAKPLVCRLEYKKNKNICMLDMSKAYTKQLLKINYVPVITLFNYPKKYNGEEIDDYYMYLIKLIENNCLFNEKYTVIYGYNLKQLILKYEILQYLDYSYLEEIDTKDIVDECFYTDDLICDEEEDNIELITEKDQKFIMCNSIGELGKIKNKKEKSSITTTEADVQRKVKDHGGNYFKIENEEGKKLYFHVNKSYGRYKNGFLPFHTMIYDNMRMALNDIVNDLIKLGYNIYGIKTDAIYIVKNYKLDINIILKKYGLVEEDKYINSDDGINIKKSKVRENIGKLKYIISVDENDTIHGMPY